MFSMCHKIEKILAEINRNHSMLLNGILGHRTVSTSHRRSPKLITTNPSLENIILHIVNMFISHKNAVRMPSGCCLDLKNFSATCCPSSTPKRTRVTPNLITINSQPSA
ncbi:hypothetical protein F511_16034 [Dorcoceras hygrometricum]|uniref:Uncharacterized protein n=1 Tax=Dorcoceras hygrometricum TaxID=472368 RepID=A0A2Z7C1H0_9LAMI|nr:hypothetical protein F511_16034 [Dorcoceras hygrometricum]